MFYITKILLICEYTTKNNIKNSIIKLNWKLSKRPLSVFPMEKTCNQEEPNNNHIATKKEDRTHFICKRYLYQLQRPESAYRLYFLTIDSKKESNGLLDTYQFVKKRRHRTFRPCLSFILIKLSLFITI